MFSLVTNFYRAVYDTLQMSTDTLAAGERGDSPRRRSDETSVPTVVNKQTFVASETTLLTDVQTYFAVEKIQIPDTDVSNTK